MNECGYATQNSGYYAWRNGSSLNGPACLTNIHPPSASLTKKISERPLRPRRPLMGALFLTAAYEQEIALPVLRSAVLVAKNDSDRPCSEPCLGYLVSPKNDVAVHI
jgi:hypothetical protein